MAAAAATIQTWMCGLCRTTHVLRYGMMLHARSYLSTSLKRIRSNTTTRLQWQSRVREKTSLVTATRRFSASPLSQTSSGTAVDQQEQPLSIKQVSRNDVVRLFAFLKEEKKPILTSLALMTFSSSITLAFPAILGHIVDSATTHQDATSLSWAVGGLLGLFFVQAGAMTARSVLTTKAGENISASLRSKVFKSILSQDTAFFDKHKSGDLVNRLSSDCTMLQQALTVHLGQGIRSLFLGLGSIGMMLNVSPSLLGVSLLIFPPVLGSALYFGRKMKQQQISVQNALAEATSHASETLGNIRLVREFGQEPRENSDYAVRVNIARDLAVQVGKSKAFLEGSIFFGANVSLLAVLGYGVSLVTQDFLSIGSLTSFLMYSLYLGIHVGSLSSTGAEFLRSLGASSRLFDLLHLPPSPLSTIDSSCFSHLSKTRAKLEPLHLERVTFSYPLRPETPVLQDFNLNIPPGTIVGICGSSGSGKSTIARLLTRLYEPETGIIRIGDQNITDMPTKDLRSIIGIISQENNVLNKSIRDNIAYGMPSATNDQIVEAAKAAFAHDFIQQLPHGYDCVVGERGIALSGGQRARIAIARALLLDVPVLVFDEVTAALDAYSEQMIQQAIQNIAGSRTIIVIAHRLATLMSANMIYVLNKGKIQEAGSWDELIETNGLFADLVRLQNLS